MGSSPLTRGALSGDRERRGIEGLIPAHAGSTTAPSRGASDRTAHPRSRGEHRVKRIISR